jgi:zinc protease
MSFRALTPTWGLAVCVAVSATARAQDATRRPAVADVARITFADYRLPNGLRVILHEDHSSPIVSVHLFTHVGEKNEVKGKTGIAHLFEHLGDSGTDHISAVDFQHVIQEGGGRYNAETTNDWTHYYVTVPSNQLETLLWLQSDHLGWQHPTPERFRAERDAVDNEYRQNVLNSTATRAAEIVFGTLFAGGTYQTPLHGYEEDRQSETIDDLIAFARTYHSPNNSALVVAGDFDAPATRRMVSKYFGSIPRGPEVEQPPAPAAFRGETRLALENPTKGVNQFWIAWRGADSPSPDRIPLVALSAILESRLNRILVSDRHLATTLDLPTPNRAPTFAAFDLEKSGVFQVTAGVSGSLSETERVIDSVVADIKANGVTAKEVSRFVAGFKTRLLMSMMSVEIKATMLGDAALTQNDPAGQFTDLQRAGMITPADVQRVAKKYLGPDRVVMSVVQAGKLSEVSKPDQPFVSVPWKK